MPIHQTIRQFKSLVQWQPRLPLRRPPPRYNNGRRVAGAETEVAGEAEEAEEAAEEAAEEEEVHPVDNLPLCPRPQHQAHLTTEED